MFAIRIHGYEILNEIGMGGMSRVYLAYDPQNQRQVAIKVLPSEYLNDLGFRARFEQEAQLIAALEHEAIVPVYEYGVYQGQPFIVMQYMPNGSLADHLSHGPLSPGQAGQVLARISNALDYAHRQGIIHRDLKASNILFDQDDNAFLADFGVALRVESTWQGILASGTPAYMSPEQALREEVIDARSDVYSLGIIAFEMLTGGLPFDGDLPISFILKHIHDPPPSLGAVDPGSPPALDPVLQRAMAKDPQERYPSAAEFLNAFQHALQQTGSKSPAVDLRRLDSSIREPQKILSDPSEDMPLAESASPARQPHKPIFPELAVAFDGKSRHHSNRREGYTFYTMGLVIWCAVIFAAFTAVIARAQELFPSSNVEVVYHESAVAVINLSSAPIDLSNVVFQRLSDQGSVNAAFSAEQWERINPGALRGLSQGDCFQLVRSGEDNLPLIPGTAPAKPHACGVSRGWLIASDETWHFWIPDGDGATFQVIQGDRVIHKCRIADGICHFNLPQKD
ncbi:MAG TPA: serine/threonine-protein kinase [Anaerolineales bacterium]|nr:serine/threonine-protein kinase [Anaerolineales bacterium]